jgi:hypothetical protein
MPPRRGYLVALQVLAALVLAGCTVPISPPPSSPGLEVAANWQGWVKVKVTDIPAAGYRLWWGDAPAPYGISEVIPSEAIYEHFYQAVSNGTSGGQVPAQYQIQLVDPEEQVVAQESISVLMSACYVSLLSVDERTVTVKCWGRFGVGYSISWGDRFADQVLVDDETATAIMQHTYQGAGSYAIGMRELVAPEQSFFVVTVQ